MPLEDDRSMSDGLIKVWDLMIGWRVFDPELPGEEEEVMAVTSASRPSLTTLTLSMSVRFCLKSVTPVSVSPSPSLWVFSILLSLCLKTPLLEVFFAGAVAV